MKQWRMEKLGEKISVWGRLASSAFRRGCGWAAPSRRFPNKAPGQTGLLGRRRTPLHSIYSKGEF